MGKVVINSCYGGFGLSDEACRRYWEIRGETPNEYLCDDFSRTDPILIQVVEELGDRANGEFADLEIVEVNGPYRIREYDGCESVETPDSIQWSYA